MIDLIHLFRGLELEEKCHACLRWYIDPATIGSMRVVRGEEIWQVVVGPAVIEFVNEEDALIAIDRAREVIEEATQARQMLPAAMHNATVKSAIKEMVDEMKKW